MKKIAAIVIVIAIAFTTAGIAQELLKTRGVILNIDKATMSVTMQPEGGQKITIIMNDAELLSKVEVGQKAEVRYTVKDGKNIGTRIRQIKEGCGE